MKKLFKYSAISLGCMLVGMTSVHATSYQIFSGINFSNPAALNSVKDQEYIIGSTALFSRFQFNGTAAGTTGTVNSNTLDYLPYGRIAKRLSQKIVVGLDITQPFYTNIQYPSNSFANMFSTSTVLRDVNYSPKISYQVNEKLALGVGFDANDMYDAQLNFALPPFGNMINRARNWAYGWDVGLFYALAPTTFLNVNYYSKIVQHLNGTSSWGPLTNNSLQANSILPATYIFNLVHIFPPNWVLSGTIRYAQWNSLQYIVLQNTAVGNLTIPYHFFNNISAELATHYQINSKWGALAAIDYEPNVQPTYTRNIGLPTYTRIYPAIGADYEILKGLKAKLVYAYVYSRPPISMTIPTGQSLSGNERLNANAIDLSLSYDV